MRKLGLMLGLLLAVSGVSAFGQGVMHDIGDPRIKIPQPNCAKSPFYVDDSSGQLYIAQSGSPCVWDPPNSSSGLPQPSYSAINMWGDSLTAGNQDGSGITVCAVLATLSGRTCNNQGVSGNTSTQILARMTASPPAAGTLNIIWACTNDPTIQPCIANIQSMVSIVQGAGASFLVLPPQNTDNIQSHAPNGLNYLQFFQISQTEQSLYPANYINTREQLVGRFSPASLGDTGSYAYDISPFSYRAHYAGGTLTADITSSTCSIGVTGIPTAVTVNDTILIDSEYIWVSAYSSPNVTGCVRGYYGSAAATHTAGTTLTIADGVHLSGNPGYTYIANQIYQWMNANPSTASNWLTPISTANALTNTALAYSSAGFLSQLQQRYWAYITPSNYFAGNGAAQSNNGGVDNTALGYESLFLNTTGGFNTCVGYFSCRTNVTATALTGQGYQALNSATAGPNTGFGFNAGELITSGANNVALGDLACVTGTAANAVTTASGITCIGDKSGFATTTQFTDSSAFGYQAFITKSHQVMLGDNATVEVASPGVPTSVGTTAVSGCSLTSAVGGKWAGQFVSGTTGTCTVTITTGATATNGHSCWANDITTPADKLQQTVASTTAPQISGTTVSGDVITWGCVAY